MRSLVHEPLVFARFAESFAMVPVALLLAVAAESTRPAALSVRAAAVSAVRSALLHAPSAPTHSTASESLVNRSAWPVMFRLRCMGGLPGSRRHASEMPMAEA